MCVYAACTSFISTRVHNGAAATSQSALTNWVKIFHLAPNWSVLGIFHFHFILHFLLTWEMSSVSCCLMELHKGWNPLKKLQCLHILMMNFIPWYEWCYCRHHDVLYMRTISHFSTRYHSHNYCHTICICMPHRSPHLPCLDTCDAATSILSAELLKVHLKSVQQNAVHGERNKSSKWTILKYIFTPSCRNDDEIYNNNKMDFQFHQNERVAMEEGEGDYEIEFRFISWIFKNRMWCMHISHCLWYF